MNFYEQEIASALREMADQAATPLPRIEAAWRAGRRRRRNAMTASVAGAAGVTAVAALVPMNLTGGPGGAAAGAGRCDDGVRLRAAPQVPAAASARTLPVAQPVTPTGPLPAMRTLTLRPVPPPMAGQQESAGQLVTSAPRAWVVTSLPKAQVVMSLPKAYAVARCPAPVATPIPVRTPKGPVATTAPPPLPEVQVRQVAKVVHQACPQGTHGLPGTSKRECYYFTTKELQLALQSVEVVRMPGVTTAHGQPAYTVRVTLQPGKAGKAGELGALNTLIAQIRHQAAPRDELAWIMDGRVVTSQVVTQKLPATFPLTGPGGLAAQQQLARDLEEQGKPLYTHGQITNQG
jgi:hypothetical protein